MVNGGVKSGRRHSLGLLSWTGVCPLPGNSSNGGGSSGYRPLLTILVTLFALAGLLSGLLAPSPTPSAGLIPRRPRPHDEEVELRMSQAMPKQQQQPPANRTAPETRNSLKLSFDAPTFATVNGVPVAFQGPVQGEGAKEGPVRGVWVLLHGCTHTEADWFTLPEERRLVSLLHSRGYAVLAVKSRGVCWEAEEPQVDLQPVASAVSTLVTLWSSPPASPLLPLYCFGASSGGTFAMVLPRALPMLGVVAQISPGLTTGIDRWKQSRAGVALVYMPRDVEWASEEAVRRTGEALQALGHRVVLLPCSDSPVMEGRGGGDGSWFFHRGAVKSAEESQALVAALREEGDLLCGEEAKGGRAEAEGEGGKERCVLRRDPRGSGVYGRLEKREGPVARLMADEEVRRSVEEELNVLWGVHELTSERAEEWLDFMEMEDEEEEGQKQ